MDRRDFLMASGLAGAASLSAGGVAMAAEGATEREYYEIRKYHLHAGEKGRRVNDFFENAAIPALNRAGVGPVGAFQGTYGAPSLTLHVLLTHKSLESVVTLYDRLADDAEYQQAGASFLNAPLSDPAYVRMESSLMAAFAGMPKLEAPDTDQGRIFELRRYESHSAKAGKKKIEMFNDAGEIRVFRKTGLIPVFFAESIIGPNLPNLTYMLTFKDMAERDASWQTFLADPEWKEMSQLSEYAGTVSNIEDTILRPTGYSQI